MTRYVAARENEANGRVEFELFNESTFPLEAKRTRSAAIRQCIADRIIRRLKREPEDDRNTFAILLKKGGFVLLDVLEAGIRDVLLFLLILTQ